MDHIISLIIAAVVVVGGYLLGTRKGRKAEQTDRAAKQAKADAITHTKAKEARDEVSGMSDDDVSEWLRKRARK
ncbi:MAG: hypothetical protein ABNH17_05630 [Paracoccus sp. (in: a-proteobacteria)]|jgi:hypothetical protein|uniref:hypothetical protein n=1 Tax=Paracoccus sp. TaxID=267 RepID=UPI0032D8DA1D